MSAVDALSSPANIIPPTDPSEGVVRWLGLAYSTNLSTNPDVPFVFDTIDDAKDLLRAIVEGHGRPVEYHELVSGTVVEQRSAFPSADETAEMLLFAWHEPADLGSAYPDVRIYAGPRGGIRHERT